jgi:hypothetical protein
MENATPHDQNDSGSMSEKSGSDQGLTKQPSNGSTTQKSGQMHDSTPTTSRGEQPTGTPAMPPPPRPKFKATPTSAQPSSYSQQDSSQELPVASSEKKHGSGRQRTTSSRDSGQEATKPVTRKRSHEEIDRRQAAEDVDDQDDEGQDEEATDEFKEPANPVAPFDWRNLEERYHDQVQDYAKQESDLYRQFGELSNVSLPRDTKHHSTNNCSTSTSGLSPEHTMRRSVASNGAYIHAMPAPLQPPQNADTFTA